MSSSKLLNTYNRYGVEFSGGSGAYLYDVKGNEYVDFLCGIAVTGFGHNHPEIKNAVLQQIDGYWHVSNLFTSTPQEELAKKLTAVSGLESVFFCNSGTEAIEAAIKFARKWGGGKFEIISAENGFHGRTLGSLSATGQANLREGFEPMVPGFKYVPYGDIAAVKEAVTENTAAVLVEPIQGEGGVIVPPAGYLKAIRELCTEKNILLILDEVQTGNGRTGQYFAYKHDDILPDIIATAKGLANGFPLGAAICSAEVSASVKPGNHGSTFGGNPVAVAAANKVMDLLDEAQLNAISRLGTTLTDGLHGLNMPEIKEVRGKGLMIGIELKEGISAKKAAALMLDNGFLVGTSGDAVMRILPPFVITQTEIMKFLVALRRVLSVLSAEVK